jgi:small nuclear ribonucleoprotein (snRNP)-like protein
MKRRKMIRQIAILTGGLPFLHSMLNASVSINALSSPLILTNTLDSIIDIIIPEGKTPGGVSLGVPEYVKIMLQDCVTKDQQSAVETALKYLENQSIASSGVSFTACNAEQRTVLLKNAFIQGGNVEKDGLKLIKSLTIKGYQTSSHFMKQIIPYEMAPNRYNGCATVN